MPRPYTLAEHQIIWWIPIPGEFVLPSLSGPVSGVGKLCQPRYNELRTSVLFLIDRVKRYKESTTDRNPPNLQASIKWVQQVLDQLYLVPMSFRHVQFVVRDLQRVWLNIWAILDYMEIYKPRIDNIAPPADGVADTVGTFTMSIRVAQDMFLAGLPCWLIRPSSSFSDERIFRIAQIFHPKDYVVLDPHKFNYPVIFKGPATSLDKYLNMELFARNFLCSQDPFAIPSSSTASSTSGPSQPSTSSTPPVASSSATRPSTGRISRGDSRGSVRRPARGRGAGKFSRIYIIVNSYVQSLL